MNRKIEGSPSTGASRQTGTRPPHQQLADTGHASAIEHSHERSAAFGLSRIERPDFGPIARADLSVLRDRNRRLYERAAPVMEMLYEQIVNTESMVVLTDATGTVLHSIGDDEFLGRAAKVALAPGADWSERAKGTNAVGTALVSEAPTVVHADEHYLQANHFLTCSAAPIVDPRGDILGVLDVSGDQRSYHQHTMGLVKMSARMIENRWLSDDFADVLRMHFHTRPEFIGTLMEGIIAISPDGRVLGANRGALEQLGISSSDLRMNTLESVFGLRISALVDRFGSQLDAPILLNTSQGRSYYALARFSGPAWVGTLPPPAPILARAEGSTRRGHSLTPGHASAERPGHGLSTLRTGDAQMTSVIDKLARVLNRDIPVLILGETGTGKEVVARAIHQDSERHAHAFVVVNCASIPESLIEAELFGYEEGAFSGARRKRAVGKIVQSSGGTLFLDEIGDMPVALQARLLRVLQERQVTPLGSGRAIGVDLRIVCATHRNLREMISAHAFREDLYYRLNGLAVRLPALRDRTDLSVLVARILDRECGRRLRPDDDVMDLFRAYTWPGNIRQLFNVLRTAGAMASNGQMLQTKHLPDDFLDEARPCLQRLVKASGSVASTAGVDAPWRDSTSLPDAKSLSEIELQTIRHAVDLAGGNISEASKRLGISRNTIYRRLRR